MKLSFGSATKERGTITIQFNEKFKDINAKIRHLQSSLESHRLI